MKFEKMCGLLGIFFSFPYVVCNVLFQCAVTCGHGYQMRAVRCVLGDYGDTVDDRECNAAARPRDSQVKTKCMSKILWGFICIGYRWSNYHWPKEKKVCLILIKLFIFTKCAYVFQLIKYFQICNLLQQAKTFWNVQ